MEHEHHHEKLNLKTTSKEVLAAGRITTIVSVIINSLLSASKITVGFASGSTALIADGFHSLTDLATDIFAYIMLKISHRHADSSHPYGHGKFESIGTLIIAVLLAISAIWVTIEALERLVINNIPNLGPAALATAVFSIIANEGLYQYCKYKGEQVNSSIIIANAWHHRSDSLTSIAALIGITLNIAGFVSADSLAAIFVTAILLKMAYHIGHQAFDELVDASIEKEKLQQIAKTIDSIKVVDGHHQLRARKLGSSIFVDVHIEVEPYISVTEGHSISETIEHTLKEHIKGVEDVIVHIDPNNITPTSMPENINRKEVKKIIEKAILAEGINTTIDGIIIHIISPKKIELDITINTPKATSADLARFSKKITKQLPQFTTINLYNKF